MLFSSTPEPAFATYRLWRAIGFIVAFAYSAILCMKYKIIITAVMLVLAIVGYGWVEIRFRRREQTLKSVDKSRIKRE